jgi:diketogulonate reductase-like aldo/keto reductase
MATLTTDGRARVLNDGNEMPLLGLGVWQVKDGDETYNSVRWALELGYRHIDTAQAYGNEESDGRALADSGIARDEVFITTKFYPRSRSGDPAAEAEKSCRRLGVDQVDLYLIHWPEDGPTWAWPGMQQAVERGFAKSIGISNFDPGEMDALLAEAEIRPTVNQVQFGPFKFRSALLAACEEREIVLESYSPLNSSDLGDRRIQEIAEGHGRTPAQVLLRWVVQRDIPVIPKSVRRERIEENGQIFDFDLADEEMEALDSLDTTGGTDGAQERKWW